MIKGILPPARTSSRKVSDLRLNLVINFPFSSFISPLAGKIETISPILRFSTSASKTKVPESSIVLKNIGATFSPIQIPPVFLFGIKGISSPMCQRTELVADFLDEPVPITSPTKVTGKPFSLRALISFKGSFDKPFLGILYMDRA